MVKTLAPNFHTKPAQVAPAPIFFESFTQKSTPQDNGVYKPGSELSPRAANQPFNKFSASSGAKDIIAAGAIATIHPPPTILFRKIEPLDLKLLQSLHEAMFPIRYEPEFFESVVHGKGVVSWGAVDATHPEKLIGFVTAAILSTVEIGDSDILAPDLIQSGCHVVYILTLGVTKPYRKFGVASKLVQSVIGFGTSAKDCRAIYLHVIAYNQAAMQFYRKNSFQAMGRLPRFYFINGNHYDSYLYVYYVNGGRPPYCALDLAGLATTAIQKFCASLLERFLWKDSGDDKGAKWSRFFELVFSGFNKSLHNRIAEVSDSCTACV